MSEGATSGGGRGRIPTIISYSTVHINISLLTVTDPHTHRTRNDLQILISIGGVEDKINSQKLLILCLVYKTKYEYIPIKN